MVKSVSLVSPEPVPSQPEGQEVRGPEAGVSESRKPEGQACESREHGAWLKNGPVDHIIPGIYTTPDTICFWSYRLIFESKLNTI